MKALTFDQLKRNESTQTSNEFINVFHKTFSDSENEAEGELIASLVKDLLDTTPVEDIFAFMAYQNQTLVGAIICSRIDFTAPVNGFILSPVAVLPAFQKQGIGQALIEFSKQQLQSKGETLFITYGDPSFYEKVGFKPVTTQQIPAPQPLSMPIGWLAQTLDGSELPNITGKAKCVSALNDPKYW